MGIERFSSRREALGPVLRRPAAGASRYLRIAGYFRSSLLEVVGEALETVGEIRVVCNGDLDPHRRKGRKGRPRRTGGVGTNAGIVAGNRPRTGSICCWPANAIAACTIFSRPAG